MEETELATRCFTLRLPTSKSTAGGCGHVVRLRADARTCPVCARALPRATRDLLEAADAPLPPDEE
jgi:hypothetical protein